jgi:GH18 family chitinase
LILSAALPAGKDKYGYLNLKELSDQLDFINIMTYDYHGGSWEQDGPTAPHTPWKFA